MKIHGLCIVKNEADVIEECLVSAAYWCDDIYVFDNGSTDGTWELVGKLSERYPQIVPYKQDDTLFSDGLRADIFNAFRSKVCPGDWWCRLDADEFYIDDPRIFVAKIPDRFQKILTASFSYYFTDQDVILFKQDPVKYIETPLQQRLRFYLNHWSEIRFFRHRDDIVWTRDHGGFPKSLSEALAYPVRIWVKHYAYRSPEQIEQRLRTRRPAIEAGVFSHEAMANWSAAVAAIRETRAGFEDHRPELAGTRWEDRIVPASSLDYDAFDRRYVLNEDLMPQIPRRRLEGVIPESMRGPFKWLLREPLRMLNQLRPIAYK